jgi:hypothetical protein
MGRKYTVSAHKAPCPACSVADVTAVRTDCSTQQKSISPVKLVCKFGEGKAVVKVEEGGVTGYESCYFTPDFKNWTLTKGWWACAGTPGRYDGLFIPAKEMRVALERFRLT